MVGYQSRINVKWVIPENIHTYTTGSFLEFRGQGVFFELEFERHGGNYDKYSKSSGRGGSRGDKQECECIRELTTLLMSVESKTQDKH